MIKVTNKGDGSIDVKFSFDVESGATTEQLGSIVTEQWPGTLLWTDIDPGYNYLVQTATC